MCKPEAHHENHSHSDPSPHDLGDLFWSSINPVQQYRIAREIANDPSHLYNHPQDLLLPSVLVQAGVLKVADAGVAYARPVVDDAFAVGKDGFEIMGDQLGVTRDTLKTLVDVLTLDFGEAYKDGKNAAGHVQELFKDYGRLAYDSGKLIWHVASPIVSRPLAAGQEAMHTAGEVGGEVLDAGKHSMDAVGHDLGFTRDSVKTLADIATFDFSSVGTDASNAFKHAVGSVESKINVVGDGVSAIGKGIKGSVATVGKLIGF